jgi:hypothetical protein
VVRYHNDLCFRLYISYRPPHYEIRRQRHISSKWPAVHYISFHGFRLLRLVFNRRGGRYVHLESIHRLRVVKKYNGFCSAAIDVCVVIAILCEFDLFGLVQINQAGPLSSSATALSAISTIFGIGLLSFSSGQTKSSHYPSISSATIPTQLEQSLCPALAPRFIHHNRNIRHWTSRNVFCHVCRSVRAGIWNIFYQLRSMFT